MSNGDTLQSTLLVSEVGEEGALGLDVLDVSTVLDASLLGLEVEVLLLVDVGETPLLGDDLQKENRCSSQSRRCDNLRRN
jgi:hypothetical protein